MIGIKAKLQLWKQNTQNVLRGRPNASRSRSSSDSSQMSGNTSDSQQSDSFTRPGQDPANARNPGKAPPTTSLQAELERVAAFQNKKHSRITRMIAENDGREDQLHPAYVRPDALHKLGFAKSAKRSEEILSVLGHLNVVDGNLLIKRQTFNMDSLISLANGWPGAKPLTDKEQHGLKVYVEGMQFNLDELGKNFADLKKSQRPYALYYAGFANTPMSSEYNMQTLKEYGVVDKHFKPIDGGLAFDNFKNFTIKGFVDHNTGRAPRENLFATAHDLTEKMRDALFPLPSYVAPKISR